MHGEGVRTCWVDVVLRVCTLVAADIEVGGSESQGQLQPLLRVAGHRRVPVYGYGVGGGCSMPCLPEK